MHWFLDPLQHQFADFSGRTSRQAFWMFVLVYVLVYIGVSIVASLLYLNFLTIIFSLALLIPSIAITARRLHDIGMSGWWQLIGLIPLVGLIIMIVLLVRDSEPGDNQFGPDPKGRTVSAAASTAPVQNQIEPGA